MKMPMWMYGNTVFRDMKAMMRSKSNIYYTVLNAAVSEWMDAAGDFPVDEDWNYLAGILRVYR